MNALTRPGVPLPGGLFLGRNTKSGNLFWLSPRDRTTHCHILGQSGKGKSSFLEACVLQDIVAADGVRRSVTFIDPHGESVQRLLALIARYRLHRHRRIRLLRPADPAWSFGFNPFVALQSFDLVALCDLITIAILQVWGQDRTTDTPLIGEVLHELLYAIGRLGLPLSDAGDFLSAHRERERLAHLKRLSALDPDAGFWPDLERLSSGRRDDYLAPVRRRLNPFFASPFVRRIFSQSDRALDVAAEMDNASVLLIDLSSGPLLSPEAARLLGLLLTNEFHTACHRRRNRRPAYLYMDECQNYLSPNIARMLDESRKFSLSVVLAHQHLGHLRQAGEHVFRSVMTNTHVKVIFGGLDTTDAQEMAQAMFRGHFDLERAKERWYRPTAVGNDLVELANASTTVGQSTTATDSWSRGRSRSRGTARHRSRTQTDGHADTTTTGTTTTSTSTESEGYSYSENQGSSTTEFASETEHSGGGGGVPESLEEALADLFAGPDAPATATTEGESDTNLRKC